ncbi:MAG TPA: molybdate ABC transporter substrate-binding protein [Marmoricola sp.]|nr:molybdate ABC transporter substrate-binding protein [Marmoricola sp.]
MRAALPVLLATVLTACGTDAAGGGGSDETLRVFAAASLTGAFTELAEKFETDNPGTTVELNFGPSSGLAEQISSGAPADVFASASQTTMDVVIEAGDAVDPQPFVRNTMQIAVPRDNPAGITRLDQLGDNDVKVALCQPQVPCGEVSAEVFDNAGLTVEPVTEEVDVKGVLTKVSLGEVDAGVVYVTDVLAAGDEVTGVEIPAAVNASTTYPIAMLERSERAEVAEEFVDLVLSEAGTRVLERAGFERP